MHPPYKIVVRLLDTNGDLLGWKQVNAKAKDGKLLCPNKVVSIPVEMDGTPAMLSFHWCGVNTEWRVLIGKADPIKAGSTYPLVYEDPTMCVVGPKAPSLPPVTIRENVHIEVPVGAMGVRSH